MDVSQIVAVAVFVVVMITIMTEKLHRSLAAITGAMIVLALHVMPFDAAMEHIDFNTLGVLLGMMLFVSVVKLSGVFEFLAIKCARLAKGDPWKIMLLFVLLTAVLSAFLDNVTTVLLIGPMTLTVCKLLDVNPIPFFMTEILASNIGGTATLIGDPPNIMIGSAAGYSFFDFILYDAPAVAIILVAILGVFYALYGRKMNVDDEHKARIMELDEHAQIKNRRLLKQSVVMTALVVVGFMAHGALGLESCIIALGAAGIIMLISGESIEEALSNVEWTTLSFFAGLFVIVGAPTPGSSRHAIRCLSCRPAESAACRSSNMLPTYGPLRRTDLASCICTCRTPPMRTRSCLRSILARTPSNSCTSTSMPRDPAPASSASETRTETFTFCIPTNCTL